MIIYFEDGYLQMPWVPPRTYQSYHRVYAAAGYNTCEEKLNEILRTEDPYTIVYTNSVAALQNKYCWNNMLGCTLYFRDKYGEWYHADAFTYKELRPAYNFFSLYKSGEFGWPGTRETVSVFCQNCFETKLSPERLEFGHKICPECEASMKEEAFLKIDLDKFLSEE